MLALTVDTLTFWRSDWGKAHGSKSGSKPKQLVRPNASQPKQRFKPSELFAAMRRG